MHTEGKLIVRTSDESIGSIDSVEMNAQIAQVFQMLPRNEDLLQEQRKANARRLVACWNACDGIPVQWIEGGAVTILEHSVSLVKERNELVKALRELVGYADINTCNHEDTHRGGSIWEICDSCGHKWADDHGGKPVWRDPTEIENAKSVLAKYPKS